VATAKAGATIKAWWSNPENKAFAREAIQEAVKGRVYPDKPCVICGVIYTPTNGSSKYCDEHISDQTRSRRKKANRLKNVNP
jgi:hypothetical protein